MRFMFTPAQAVADKMRVYFDEFHYLLLDKKDLENKIDKLTSEMDQYKIQSIYLEEYRAEIERLQVMLDFQSRYPENLSVVSAHVIARSPNTWDQLITIDRGTKDGVKVNMPVITPDGLVGIVSAVNPSTAQVYLIIDREIAVGVLLLPTREARGIIEGTGSVREMKLGNIPYYSEIQVGDTVITSGLSDIYPKGILVGTIREIIQETSGLLISAKVEPAVHFDQLEEVMVITKLYADMDFSVVEEPENPLDQLDSVPDVLNQP